MAHSLFLLGATLAAALSLQPAAAQKPAAGTYMQIFYEGPGWLAGRRVLAYSPAFRGKTQEVIQETDSTRQLSPNGLMMGTGASVTTTSYATVTTERGTFISDGNGKSHLETPTERQQAQQREAAQFNRGFRLLEARADLGRAVLTRALNEAAADGWEVVQLAPTSTQGGLVYLLKRRSQP
jgi:hypothetical protein